MKLTSTGRKHSLETKLKMRKPRIKPHPPRTIVTKERIREFALARKRNSKGLFE